MFHGPVEDRVAMRELFDSYGDAVIRHDAAAWTSLWTADAVWSLRGREILGRIAIGAAWEAAMAAYRFVSFSTFPAEMWISGELAVTRANTLEVYDTLRKDFIGTLMKLERGNPKATGEAILKVVDAAEPPLRLILGSTALPEIRSTYADRLATWSAWQAVSDSAQ